MTADVIVLDPLFGDSRADAMVRLCEDFPGYGLYVTERSGSPLTPDLAERYDAARNHVQTGGRFGRTDEPLRTRALRTNYLRESYAYGDRVVADGIGDLLHHERLVDAARRLHGRHVVVPAIAYANILLPGQELAVHTDVPEFRGANRTMTPQWLLVVMHHSGLFDQWRMPIATGVSYFAPTDEVPTGGELVYWPDGADGEPAVFPTAPDTAVVLDTDSVFHGVDRVGSPDQEPPPVVPGTVLTFDRPARRWSLRSPDGTETARYGWSDLRFSVSWKAYCFADDDERAAWQGHAHDLSLDLILTRLEDDLRQRGRLTGDVPTGEELARLLIDTYERYPAPAA